MQSYPERQWYDGGYKEPTWREVEPFEATLEYVHYTRGRSSVTFVWQDLKTGQQYPMFLTDMDKIVKLVQVGRIRGTWEASKRGTNYGIRLVQNG